MIRVCPLCWSTVSNVSARWELLLLLPWDPGRAILRLYGRAFERHMRQLLSHIRQNLCKLRIIRHLLRFFRNILAYISAVWFCRTYVASLRSSRLYPVALHCGRSPTARCNGIFGAVLRPRRADKCKSEKGERRERRFACVFRRDGEPGALFYRRVLCGQSRYFFRKQSEGNGAACYCRAACFGLFFCEKYRKNP